MKYIRMLAELHKRMGLPRQQADHILGAMTRTLAELLSQADRERLADQLPEELKNSIGQAVHNERYDLEEFYNRLGARAGLRHPEAVRQARVAAAVLRHALSSGELDKLLDRLPDHYDELFGLEPAGPLSPSHP